MVEILIGTAIGAAAGGIYSLICFSIGFRFGRLTQVPPPPDLPAKRKKYPTSTPDSTETIFTAAMRDPNIPVPTSHPTINPHKEGRQ